MSVARLFIDYQNVHLTGWEQYGGWPQPLHECLIHPGRFASEIERIEGDRALRIAEVCVFRGLPDPRKQSKLNSYVSRQHQMWSLDPRVKMQTRPLRYPREWPEEKAQEKGIDVMFALAIVRAALDGNCTRIYVATRDTDSLPAIEMADAELPGSVSLVSWENSGKLRPGCSVERVEMGEESFKRSLDLNRY